MSDKTAAFVLGKFLPPHLGHKYLIDFAKNYPGVELVHVLVGGQPHEVPATKDRWKALRNTYPLEPNMDAFGIGRLHVNVIMHYVDETMPQEPSAEYPYDVFWDMWKDLIFKSIGTAADTIGYVFASEAYGKPLADLFGAKFVPVDIERSVNPMSGTGIRENINANFQKIIPEFRKLMSKSITIFGSESCGKTTMARALSRNYGRWIPEYARGYLDAIGVSVDVTEQHMEDIVDGQVAAFKAVQKGETLFTFRDTDLFTTLGYWKIMGFPLDNELFLLLGPLAKKYQADHYFVLDTDVEFVPDHLRYGGHVRTSDTKFWTDILDEFEVPYDIIRGTYEGRRREIDRILREKYYW